MKNKKEYTLKLTQNEIDALPILFDMAEKMTWLLYSEDKSVQNILGLQGNIIKKQIDDYHNNKNNYGICATAIAIEKKIINLMRDSYDYVKIMMQEDREVKDNLINLANHKYVKNGDVIHIKNKDDNVYTAMIHNDIVVYPFVKEGKVKFYYQGEIRGEIITITTEMQP